MPNILVRAAALTRHFQVDDRRVEVLRGVDLELAEGEITAVVGPSGAGKSTLLHIIGLLDTPSSGTVTFAGRDVSRMTESQRAEFRLQRIGFVFQFHHLLPEFTALENVMLPALVAGKGGEAASARAAEILEWVGLSQRLQHKPGELSGGEQQRVAFARALVNRPDLLLADEPTGNLDREASQRLRELLWGICHETGAALLLVTHNETLSDGASRVLAMTDGRLSA